MSLVIIGDDNDAGAADIGFGEAAGGLLGKSEGNLWTHKIYAF